MRYLSILIVGLFILSCKHKPKPVKDDFGIEKFDTTKRVLPPEEIATARRKHNQPPVPPNPPPPSGRGVILLDFDGDTVRNTSWNYAGDIICSPSNLTLSEQQIILDTVAYHYRTFNVIVTTDENVYNAAPPTKRTRCIITESYQWYGMSGGTSFIGSMKWGDNTPCFVFSTLLNYNTKKIQEAATHEPGHTLGLLHQSQYDSSGIKTSEYNECKGLPYGFIMGFPYANKIQIWGVGYDPYHKIQVDTAIIINALK